MMARVRPEDDADDRDKNRRRRAIKVSILMDLEEALLMGEGVSVSVIFLLSLASMFFLAHSSSQKSVRDTLRTQT